MVTNIPLGKHVLRYHWYVPLPYMVYVQTMAQHRDEFSDVMYACCDPVSRSDKPLLRAAVICIWVNEMSEPPKLAS